MTPIKIPFELDGQFDDRATVESGDLENIFSFEKKKETHLSKIALSAKKIKLTCDNSRLRKFSIIIEIVGRSEFNSRSLRAIAVDDVRIAQNGEDDRYISIALKEVVFAFWPF